MNSHRLITVITVCYNSERAIKRTIDSVINQTAREKVEFIIIDGNSNDATLDIIKKIHIENKGLGNFILKSEADAGVYDAMNKGATLATGEWILYLNSGDIFHDSKIIEDFIQHLEDIDAMVVYGDTIYKNGKKEFYHKSGQAKNLTYKKPFCHQSVFVRTEIQNKYKFNCKYRIQADYDMFLRIYLDGLKIERWNRIISIFAQDGISSDPQNYGIVYKELKCLHKENGLNMINTPILLFYYIKCTLFYLKTKIHY